MDRDQALIAFCQESIRIPSPSGQEKQVAELMKAKMEEYGFDEVQIDRYGSVLGRIHGKRPGSDGGEQRTPCGTGCSGNSGT